jgi:heat shock protein HslJ
MPKPPSPLLIALLALAAACGTGPADEPAGEAEGAPDAAMSTDTSTDPADLLGTWTFERVRDRPVVDRSPAHVVFDAEGGVAGSASCNRMTGSYTVEGGTLTLSPLAVTRRMCVAEALMEQEARVLEALEEVAGWRIEQGLLVLTDADGQPLFRASRQVEAGQEG